MIETAPLREISIVSYLAYKGIEPANYRAGNFWYRSPLREGDKTPSFVVHEGKNRWHDFATGEGGSIIDLVLQMQPQSSFKEVLEHLQAFAGIAHSFKPAIDHSQAAPAETTGSTSFILDKLVPVNELYRLTDYLASRNITQTAAEQAGIKAALYHTHTGHKRFALAFKNNSGGYELRNPDFKGTLGKKDITFIQGLDNIISVFEGFLDYTSFRRFKPSYNGSALILNSTALVDRAVELLQGQSENPISRSNIHLFLDNDEAGDKATRTIMSSLPKGGYVEDLRWSFRPYNDLNEALQGKGLNASLEAAGFKLGHPSENMYLEQYLGEDYIKCPDKINHAGKQQNKPSKTNTTKQWIR